MNIKQREAATKKSNAFAFVLNSFTLTDIMQIFSKLQTFIVKYRKQINRSDSRDDRAFAFVSVNWGFDSESG